MPKRRVKIAPKVLEGFILEVGARRVRLNMTQGQLAKKAGTTQATLSGVENRKGNPSIGLLQDIAKALGGELEIRITDRN